MKSTIVLLAFLVSIATHVRAAEVTLDLAGAEIGPGKEIHLNSGLQRLPASAAYEFELAGTVRGTGLLATLIPTGTSLQDLADTISPGATIPTGGVVPNPSGQLPFGVIKQNFSGGIPIPGVPVDVNVALKVRAGVAANGRIYFDFTGLDLQIPGLPVLGSVKFEPASTLTIRSLFEQFAGSYCGRVNGFNPSALGIAKIKISSGGLLTGQLQLGSKTYRIKSGLDQNRVTPELPLGSSGSRIQFTADENDLGNISAILVGQGGPFATLNLARGIYNDGPPTPRAGLYTVLLDPPDLTSGQTPATHPVAPGILRFTVTPSGFVSCAGWLCDGTKIAVSSLITTGDTLAIFASTTSGFGALLGDVSLLSDTDPDDLGGTLRWLKTAFPTEKIFPLGVDVDLTVHGSRYVKPDAAQRALAIINASAILTAGNLTSAASIGILLTQQNKIIAPASLVLALDKASGLLTGSYKPTGAKTVKLRAVILQKQNRAAGFFVGAPGSGTPVEPGALNIIPLP